MPYTMMGVQDTQNNAKECSTFTLRPLAGQVGPAGSNAYHPETSRFPSLGPATSTVQAKEFRSRPDCFLLK